MANLELQGKLLRKLPPQRGKSARGEWVKQEFLVEYQDGNFPSTACFNVWGEDKVNDLARFTDGEDVKVSFTINSREFNNKFYTDLRAWRIASANESQQAAPSQAPHPQPSPANDIPAGFAPSYKTSSGESAEDMGDDLPF